jgi:tetratricopeptide (TPR) repeat protein
VQTLSFPSFPSIQNDFQDWWWKARLGKCYYQLGLFRDAERQFKSSLGNQNNVTTVLELCKVYVRLDQPNTALEAYLRASEQHPGDVSLVLGAARIYDALNDMVQGVLLYKQVARPLPSAPWPNFQIFSKDFYFVCLFYCSVLAFCSFGLLLFGSFLYLFDSSVFSIFSVVRLFAYFFVPLIFF